MRGIRWGVGRGQKLPEAIVSQQNETFCLLSVNESLMKAVTSYKERHLFDSDSCSNLHQRQLKGLPGWVTKRRGEKNTGRKRKESKSYKVKGENGGDDRKGKQSRCMN